ncbi:MAG: recombinase family protein [Bacillota bacterium]
MRVAVYLRVSTEEQAQRGYSLAEQEAACRRRAEELGATEVLIFSDPGVSGELLDNRPGLAALREAVRAGRVECVVVRDADRLSRKLAHQLLLVEEFERQGVRLELLDFAWKDTPEGRLFYAVRGAIAEYEKEKIRERSMRGRLQKARQGRIPALFDTYGYRYDPATGRVEVIEHEAQVVRDVFRWFVEEDLSIWGVAQRLNSRGLPTRRGARAWHEAVVRRMLANPAYVGVWYYNRRDCTGRSLNRHLPREARVGLRSKPPCEWIAVPVPAIVDPWLWEGAREKLERARRLWCGSPRTRSLLSGLLACADCGKPMHGAWMHADGGQVRAYTCYQRHAGVRAGCQPCKKVRADVVDQAVWTRVAACLRDTDALAREMKDLAGGDEEAAELVAAREALERVGRARANVLEALAAGLLDYDARTRARLEELKARHGALAERVCELERATRRRATAARHLAEWRALASRVLACLDQLPQDEKRGVIRALVRKVEVVGRGPELALRIYLPATVVWATALSCPPR